MEIRVHEHFELCWHLIKIKHYDEIQHESRTQIIDFGVRLWQKMTFSFQLNSVCLHIQIRIITELE